MSNPCEIAISLLQAAALDLYSKLAVLAGKHSLIPPPPPPPPPPGSTPAGYNADLVDWRQGDLAGWLSETLEPAC